MMTTREFIGSSLYGTLGMMIPFKDIKDPYEVTEENVKNLFRKYGYHVANNMEHHIGLWDKINKKCVPLHGIEFKWGESDSIFDRVTAVECGPQSIGENLKMLEKWLEEGVGIDKRKNFIFCKIDKIPENLNKYQLKTKYLLWYAVI